MGLGPYPEFTLADAREMAAKQGVDPIEPAVCRTRAKSMWATNRARSASGKSNPLTASVAVPMAGALGQGTRHEPSRKTRIEPQRLIIGNQNRSYRDAHDDGQ
jgi:hypothetical protein